MATVKDTATPPSIGKIGPYTVFLTPRSPPTPPSPAASPIPETPKKIVAPPPPPPQSPAARSVVAPPVQPPPAQYIKPSGDNLGFFQNAIARFQEAHSSLDEYVANWLGLNQSKYQWALDDYYESKELEKGDAKA